MKVTVLVRLKPEVLDPQGDAVRRALGKLGFEGVKDVRVGKVIEIEIDEAHAGAADLGQCLQRMADEMLANPVIEDYEVRL
jgi:phosphoribosylformylglycinamidine synthase PurS subunit